MTERLLQYIWQMQLFNKNELQTINQETLQLIFPGNFNRNQGPDFAEAKIKIGDTLLVGSVELHVKASHWRAHKHDADKNYDNVILHVVWENDKHIPSLPTLVLGDRVSQLLLGQYYEWMQLGGSIPCEKSIAQVNELVWISWKERLLAERLIRKSQTVLNYLNETANHWEETFWWMIAGNFGVTVNKESFEAIARSLPVTLLAKHKHSIHQLEALLLGQAGLLNSDFQDDYPKLLQREYQFCKTKYQLKEVSVRPSFLRMRPSAFPTIRLAQLAMLIHRSLHLFSKVIESDSLPDIRKMLDVTANDYWHYHYLMDEVSSYKPKHSGAQLIDSIIINAVAPVLFAYGLYHNEEKFKDKALKWLGEIKPESNTITQKWATLGIHCQHAFDSQALIELKTNYCEKRRCLDCAAGNAILKRTTS